MEPSHEHGAGAGSTSNSAEYTYGRVLAPEDELTSECEEVCLMVQHCMQLRDKYLFVADLAGGYTTLAMFYKPFKTMLSYCTLRVLFGYALSPL